MCARRAGHAPVNWLANVDLGHLVTAEARTATGAAAGEAERGFRVGRQH
jgi:hypothetical protein